MLAAFKLCGKPSMGADDGFKIVVLYCNSVTFWPSLYVYVWPRDVGVHVAVFAALCNLQLWYVVLLACFIAVHV